MCVFVHVVNVENVHVMICVNVENVNVILNAMREFVVQTRMECCG